MKLGTNVDQTIVSVTACSVVNFLLPWQRGTSQNWQKSLFCIVFFPSILIPKCCNFSMNRDRAKGFSACVTSYPKIDLKPFLACHMSKFSWRWGGLPPSSTPPNRGAHPPSWQPPDVTFGWGRRRKNGHIFNNISQRKAVFGA
jgi:hypothetical protein